MSLIEILINLMAFKIYKMPLGFLYDFLGIRKMVDLMLLSIHCLGKLSEPCSSCQIKSNKWLSPCQSSAAIC